MHNILVGSISPNQLKERDQLVFSNRLDVYQKPPDSGARPHKSRT